MPKEDTSIFVTKKNIKQKWKRGTQLPELMYFSFVTIPSLGYGDITPLKPIARTFAYLEAIVGQFYVAVLVAWLVGMYLSDKTQDRKQS